MSSHLQLPLPDQKPSGPHSQKGGTLCHIYREVHPWMKLSKASQEGPSSSKRRETLGWLSSIKPSHADAFSRDSDPMKEARSCYFATHPCNWIHGSTDNLSDIFRELAEGAGLLGESIYEIQSLWEEPEELRQANYSL